MRRAMVAATLLAFTTASVSAADALQPARALPPGSVLVSAGDTGAAGDRSSYGSSISDDGRYVAFESVATNLVSTPTHGPNVFLRDTVTGTTTLISHNVTGVQADAGSRRPDISGNGRWVVFESHAHDLVRNGPQHYRNVFLYDIRTDTTSVVSRSVTGGQVNRESGIRVNAITTHGRFVVFESYASNLVRGDTYDGRNDIYTYNTKTHHTTRVSQSPTGRDANDSSGGSTISADGSQVVFDSFASNLTAGDTHSADVFGYDPSTRRIRRISQTPSGVDGNGDSGSSAVSDNGRYIAYGSDATNLVPGDGNQAGDVDVYDRHTRRTTLVSRYNTGRSRTGSAPVVSGDGHYVAYLANDDGQWRVFNLRTTRYALLFRWLGIADTANFDYRLRDDGREVSFTTLDGLVAGDTNTVGDVYEAQKP